MTKDLTRHQYLQAMGIQTWVARGQDSAAVSGPRAVPVPDPGGVVSEMGWEELQQTVSRCTRCSLHETRTHTVFGVGDRKAKWVFVGEAPGADEDRHGEPFVGRAGQLLNAMFKAIGLEREQVYIANVLKCRPPNNRDPRPEEVEQCEPYLLRQIELLQPAILVALGRHAAHSLLKTDQALGRLRGTRHDYHGIPLVTTYHPAYLLRSPADKRKAWDDLKLARQIVEGV